MPLRLATGIVSFVRLPAVEGTRSQLAMLGVTGMKTWFRWEPTKNSRSR